MSGPSVAPGQSIDLEIARKAALEHHQAGLALAGQGLFAEAEQRYRRALALQPDYAEAHNNLGNALYALGRLEEAAQHYRRTLELLPDTALTHNNLAKALADLGRDDVAEANFRRALELQPDYAEAHNDYATLCQRCGRLEDAMRHYCRALELNPRFAQAHCNYGNLLKACGRRDEGARHFRLAIEVAPDSAAAHIDLGILLRDDGLREEAQEHFRRALALDPDNAAARWALTMAELPVVPESQAAAEHARARFAAEIAALDHWFDARRTPLGWRAVGVPQPFYLAYQEEDNRDLLSLHGRLCARLMAHWQQAHGLQMLPPAPGPLIRVGLVSAHFTDHSVWQALTKGWLLHVDRTRFEFHLFATDPRRDHETELAETLAASFEIGDRSLARWADAIRARRLDALIFPEIGMDPTTAKLASMRLAPVQIATWGHPETTGLPTIDYFLSAEAFEPAGAQAHYTERLVALPDLGCCYEPSPVTAAAIDPERLGINSRVPMLVCAGTPFKYAPVSDRLFTRIARRLGRCQLVFFHGNPDNLSRRLQARLERAFIEAGLKFADHVVFVPWQTRSSFYGLMTRADVFLDTIGFSGFNTAMQALECGIPVVAREGRFLRGRLASGILKQIGLHELVTASEDEYVAVATSLATDTAYRGRIRARMEAARGGLIGDTAPVHALEYFLLRATRRQ